MLYHNQVFWKQTFTKEAEELVNTVDLKDRRAVSRHVKDGLDGMDERWSHTFDEETFINAFNSIIGSPNRDIFEVEVENNKVVKAVVRVGYDKEADISFVIRRGIICSAWKNRRTDKHFTLDATKYAKA